MKGHYMKDVHNLLSMLLYQLGNKLKLVVWMLTFIMQLPIRSNRQGQGNTGHSHIYVFWGNFFSVFFLIFSTATPPTTAFTETTTELEEPNERHSLGVTLWGIIGACIVLVIVVFVILTCCCILRSKVKARGRSMGKYFSSAALTSRNVSYSLFPGFIKPAGDAV